MKILTTSEGEPVGGESPEITVTLTDGSFHLELGPHDPETGNALIEMMIEHHGEGSPVGPGWKLYLYAKSDEPTRVQLDDQGEIVAIPPSHPDY